MSFQARWLTLANIRTLFEAEVAKYFTLILQSEDVIQRQHYIDSQWPHIEAYLTRDVGLGAKASDLTCSFATNFYQKP